MLAILLQRRFTKMRILRQKGLRAAMDIGEIAAAAAGNAYFLAGFFGVINQCGFSAALAAFNGAHHARRTRTDDDDIIIKKNRLELIQMLCKTFDYYVNFSLIDSHQ